jgi:hypothetical protein
MARSYKKVPGYLDRNPFMKNYANRIIRRMREKDFDLLPDGMSYKKYTHLTWSICDYKNLVWHPFYELFNPDRKIPNGGYWHAYWEDDEQWRAYMK